MNHTAEGLEALQPELLPGELVRWSGTPQSRRVFAPIDLFLVPFSLMWGGFAIFWEVAVIRSHAPGFFVLWGAPFVLIGQYLIWGRFIVTQRLRAHTLYALTDRRALVSSRSIFGAKRLQACFLDQVAALNIRRRRDGSGTIEFGSSSGFGGLANMYRGTGLDFMAAGWGGQPAPSFSEILEVDRVYVLATNLRNEAFGARQR